MGLFDEIRCEYPLPGLPDPSGVQFQTKSFECLLDNYRITREGFLEVEEYEVEDQSDPNAEGFLRFIGIATKVPSGWNQVDFTGTVNFYGDANSGSLYFLSPEGTKMLGEDGKQIDIPKTEWFEYLAEFKEGQIKRVVRDESVYH